MLKKMLMLIVMFYIAFFALNRSVVYADVTSNGYDVNVSTTKSSGDDGGCDALFGDPEDEDSVAHFLQELFDVFKFLGPLLCIVLSVMEFLKAVTSQDKDALMKAMKRTGIRIVLALILFFLPTLINFLFPLLGWYGTCGVG